MTLILLFCRNYRNYPIRSCEFFVRIFVCFWYNYQQTDGCLYKIEYYQQYNISLVIQFPSRISRKPFVSMDCLSNYKRRLRVYKLITLLIYYK